MLKRMRVCVLLLAALLLVGCAPREASATASPRAQDTYTFTDALSRSVTVPKAPSRVVALMGSYAETWLLAGGTLAGTTQDAIDERKLTLGADTKVIGSVKQPSLEAILDLAPDFVLLSTDIESHVKLDDALRQAGIAHAYFKVELFSDYLDMLKICTDIMGDADAYRKNGLDVQARIDQVLAKAQASEDRPTVLFIRALSTAAKAKDADNMVGAMLEALGCDNIAARHPSLLEDLSMEEIIAEDPDFIFVTTMGDSDKAIAALKNGIAANPAWNSLAAVQNGRYIVLEKDLFHYKPNNRWGDSYETLAKILYPDCFA
nr:ABC transporter substrate-binding protein [Maliibacterium massiliense]